MDFDRASAYSLEVKAEQDKKSKERVRLRMQGVEAIFNPIETNATSLTLLEICSGGCPIYRKQEAKREDSSAVDEPQTQGES